MHEGSLGVHQIKLVIKTSPGLSDGGGVGQHADSSLDLGKITSRNDGWWLVVDTNFETGGAPVDELDSSLGLDGGDGSVDIFGDNISTEEQTTSHVLAVSRITFHHLKNVSLKLDISLVRNVLKPAKIFKFCNYIGGSTFPANDPFNSNLNTEILSFKNYVSIRCERKSINYRPDNHVTIT